MGMYDTIFIPCPKCGEKYPAQTKSGECLLYEYDLDTAPQDALQNVNRHAPFECDCGAVFVVKFLTVKPIIKPVVEFLYDYYKRNLRFC